MTENNDNRNTITYDDDWKSVSYSEYPKISEELDSDEEDVNSLSAENSDEKKILRCKSQLSYSRADVTCQCVFHYVILSELRVLGFLLRTAQNSASKDTTFNIINGHIARITNGLPNSFRIRSEKARLRYTCPSARK